MSFHSKARALAFAGMIAVSGCATTTQQVSGGSTAPPTQLREPETPAQRCARERQTGLQACLIEGLATTCRERSRGNDEGFMSCMTESLRPQSVERTERQFSVTVSAGQEVFSMRAGSPAMMDIFRMDAAVIDQNGVEFSFIRERLSVSAPTQLTPLEQLILRMNFDGSKTGDWVRMGFIEVWNMRVQQADGGRATVSFSSDEPALFVRTSASSATEGAQKKKK
ncbi:MAG: hypothetical protein AB1324_07775 [Candidatus Micrarchaeota archaeon]